MSKPIIQIKGIGKKYRISHEMTAAAGTGTIRDAITGIAKKPLELFTGHITKKEEFWALRDISFDVDQGDVVGIVGRNGSGKSTLLKILSRIVEPTTGEAIMRGRVASLLEVGTGFHPELTGRENVFFNGAILGMRRKEIECKFDEIVAFSEVEKFLDTPVKFYSSGMYVRLAFAVAAHLDPDVLIVDEVLAVGDVAFQKKCLGKMKSVAGQGRTVIYVSHNMASVKSLCNKGVYLKDGKIEMEGNIDKVVSSYLGFMSGKKSVSSWKRSDDRFDHPEFKPLLLKDKNIEDSHEVELKIEVTDGSPDLTIGCVVYDEDDQQVFWSYPSDLMTKNPFQNNGIHHLAFKVPEYLAEGNYSVQLIGGLHNKRWIVEPGQTAPLINFSVAKKKVSNKLISLDRPTAITPLILWKNIS